MLDAVLAGEPEFTLNIRGISSRDFATISSWEEDTLEKNSLETIQKWLKFSYSYGMFVELIHSASEKIIPVGYLIFQRSPRHCRVCRLFIAEEYRQRHVATILLEKACQKFFFGVWVKFRVHERNLDAQLFLKRRHFQHVRTMASYYEDGRDAYIFEALVESSFFREE